MEDLTQNLCFSGSFFSACTTTKDTTLLSLSDHEFFELMRKKPNIIIKIMQKMLNAMISRLHGSGIFLSDMIEWEDRILVEMAELFKALTGEDDVAARYGGMSSPLYFREKPEELMKNADQALYAAKEAGRDRAGMLS